MEDRNVNTFSGTGQYELWVREQRHCYEEQQSQIDFSANYASYTLLAIDLACNFWSLKLTALHKQTDTIESYVGIF